MLLDLGKAIGSVVDKDSMRDWVEEFESCLVRDIFLFFVVFLTCPFLRGSFVFWATPWASTPLSIPLSARWATPHATLSFGT